MRYVADKYAGGTWCGNGYFQTMEKCLEFTMDGFCDYVRVKDLTTGVTFKIHFDGHEFQHVVEGMGRPRDGLHHREGGYIR